MGNDGHEGGERGPLPGWAPPSPPGGAPVPPPGAVPVAPPWGAPRPAKRFGAGAVVGAGIGGVVLGLVLAAVAVGVLAFLARDYVAHPAVGTYGAVGETDRPSATGDCLSARPSLADVTDDEQVVPCAERHRSEVLGTTEIPVAGDRPSEKRLDRFVSEACGLALRTYTGQDPDSTSLDFGAVVPDEAAWAAGERRAWCLVDSSGADDGVGSLRRTP